MLEHAAPVKQTLCDELSFRDKHTCCAMKLLCMYRLFHKAFEVMTFGSYITVSKETGIYPINLQVDWPSKRVCGRLLFVMH